MNLDFTLAKYQEFCSTLARLNIETKTIAQYLKQGQPQHYQVILRHDVDRSIQSARRMARLEAEHKIASTYYFRTTREVFQPHVIQEIYEMGHEIGYHYEVLSTARGNYLRAIELFQKELTNFRTIVPVETISMHGSPLLPWDNRDLWQMYDFQAYGLLGEAYLSIRYENIYYFTDTGRSWNAGRYNIRDRAKGRPIPTALQRTNDLIKFLSQGLDIPIIINTHPNRWSNGYWSWSMSLASDYIINRTKLMMNQVYRVFHMVRRHHQENGSHEAQ